jgi:hypothetical protein
MLRPKRLASKVSVPFFIVAALLASPVCGQQPETYLSSGSMTSTALKVKRCEDFALGAMDQAHWNEIAWVPLTQLDSGLYTYRSEFKACYSKTGIYVLFRGEDSKITTKDYDNFDNIFNGDVFEVFLQPDPNVSVYLEYEVNAMDKELLLALSRVDGKLNAWVPRSRETKHAAGIKKHVSVEGGGQKIDGQITGWLAEIYFPYTALGLLPGVPPKPGSLWHANFCRLDYDDGSMVKWSWSPGIRKSFHELEAYQSILFE